MKIIDLPKAIIISSVIIGVFIFLSNGIYTFHSPRTGVIHKMNKVTGSAYLCVLSDDCQSFKKEKKKSDIDKFLDRK